MRPIELKVNGRARSLSADPAMPLLWALRDLLGLCGTKFGCGRGACGACTVVRDGRAVKSCQVALADCGEAEIVTVEGLSPDGAHPVQRAWLEEDVAQCGYCQPGMIMATVALLREHPDPSDAEIDAALSEVVCRCGSYPRIRRAVHRAAELARRPRPSPRSTGRGGERGP